VRVAVVIMAGGSGERFWPLSRKDRPKQFLKILGETSMIQDTFRRALLLTPVENILVFTGRAHYDVLRSQVPDLPRSNVFCEPVGRDTAPCIAMAACCLESVDPSTVMVVLPSDHLIMGDDEFVKTMSLGIQAAVATGGLVTTGVKPTRPEPAFGYILVGGQQPPGLPGVTNVERFIEKPDMEAAQGYLASGRYLWNSGMFVWTVDAIRNAIARHLPELAEGIRPIEAAVGREDFAEVVWNSYGHLPKASIDYAVMEKASNVWVVPARFQWDDLGSWTALDRVLPGDAHGNRLIGQVLSVDTKGSIVKSSSPSRLVATFGLEDAIVVDTDDVVFVASKRRACDLKKVLTHLRKSGLGAFQERPTGVPNLVVGDLCKALSGGCHVAEKPWGKEVWWSVTPHYAGKILQVKAGEALSLQYHEHKHETMLFLAGSGQIEMDGQVSEITPPMVVTISPRTAHRVQASKDLTILEISTPELDDVVRLEDRYGRSSHAGGEIRT
jgi:mannose-1-phosphate guanylyltransferase